MASIHVHGIEEHHHHAHSDGSQHHGGHHLLQVEDLTVSFSMYESDRPFFRARRVPHVAIDRLSVSVHVGEVVAVVGASGSGKSLLADAIMGLYEPNSTVTGSIWFDGTLQDARGLGSLRGGRVAFIPQSVESLNPLVPVGKQVRDACRGSMGKDGVRRQRELFARYGLERRVEDMYPFELSGGMARRVLLCMALMGEPQLIIADEPTPGLDLPLAIRAMGDLRDFADRGGSVMLITHDIELALGVADRIAVFHGGTVVEETSVASFASPDLLGHPFTRALWHALPEHDFAAADWSEDA